VVRKDIVKPLGFEVLGARGERTMGASSDELPIIEALMRVALFTVIRTNFGEGVSVLKKWLSSLSAAQESPKTRPKRYKNVVFGLRTGDTRESAKGFSTGWQAEVFRVNVHAAMLSCGKAP